MSDLARIRNQFDRLAGELTQTAASVGNAGAGADPYTERVNLIVYHLRTAARLSRELAEHAAAKETEAPQ